MDIKDIIYKKLNNITTNKIEDSSSIFSIGIDSLDLLELVTELEEELNVNISDDELKSIKIVKHVIDIFDKKIIKNNN